MTECDHCITLAGSWWIEVWKLFIKSSETVQPNIDWVILAIFRDTDVNSYIWDSFRILWRASLETISALIWMFYHTYKSER